MSKRRRKTPKTVFPNGAAKTYERALIKLIRQTGIEAIELFEQHVAKQMHADSRNFTNDSLFGGLNKMLGALKNKVTTIFENKVVTRVAKRFVNTINRTQSNNLSKQMGVHGINVSDVEPWLNEFVNEHVENNVSFIKNLQVEMYKRIEQIVKESLEQGLTQKQIAKKIMEQTGIMESRAKFLAVDQSGSILGQITKKRHEQLGISRFQWDTSGDERVRETHKELDGKIFSYDDPPEVNGRKVLPGEDYRCRCVAIPVFDDE